VPVLTVTAASTSGRLVSDVPSNGSELAVGVGYATFTRRFRALVIDYAVVAVGLFIVIIAGDALWSLPGTGPVAVIAFYGLRFLYEPLLVTLRGATIGHSATNLRVVSPSGGNPSFVRAFVRFIVKDVLGLPSFISMAFTNRHQAIHDLLTGTTVQIRDLTRESPDGYYAPAPIEASVAESPPPDPVEVRAAVRASLELSADQQLALRRLDDQVKALQARGFSVRTAWGTYNSERDAILRGKLTSSDIVAPR
jgi:uncharacterized RDD family membrane protein YckC